MCRDCLRGVAVPVRDSTAPPCTVGNSGRGLMPASASLATQSGTRMPCALGTCALAAGAARPVAVAGSVTMEVSPAGAAWGSAWSAGGLAAVAWPLDGDSGCASVSLQSSALLCSSSRPALSRPGSCPGAFAEAVVEKSCAPSACKRVGQHRAQLMQAGRVHTMHREL